MEPFAECVTRAGLGQHGALSASLTDPDGLRPRRDSVALQQGTPRREPGLPWQAGHRGLRAEGLLCVML